MQDFHPSDVTILHENLGNGRGRLRLTHRPTGLFAEAYLGAQPVMDLFGCLMNELRAKVGNREIDRDAG